MSTAITAYDVRKRYKLGGHGGPRYATFRDAVASAAAAPVRSIRGRKGEARDQLPPEFIWALKGVSFSIDQGEVVGIIGRNGAGKSTLLKILSRVTEPTQGRIELRGRVGSLLEVGTGFHPELTGRENVFLSGAVLGMTRAEIRRRFDEIAEFSGVERFLDTPVKYYSSGMQARLGFAVAAHFEPDILVVDEVLAVGDAEFQKRCLGKMDDVARAGRTVLFVSHNMTAINQLCPRTILLDAGNVVMDSATSTVVTDYLRTASQGVPERRWDGEDGGPYNSGNYIRVRGVRVMSNGIVRGEVEIDREVTIEVEFETFADGVRRAAVDIYLLDQNAYTVFRSSSRPRASSTPIENFDRPLPKGVYRHTCTIPPNFLNAQTYYVSPGVVTLGLDGWVGQVLIPEAVSFDVFDTGTMREPGGDDSWPGAIRPRLPWTVARLDGNARGCGSG
jgi:lipopolysaccharide transport system ATP-binding protein